MVVAWEGGGTAQAMAGSSHVDSPVPHTTLVFIAPLSTEDNSLRWFSLAA